MSALISMSALSLARKGTALLRLGTPSMVQARNLTRPRFFERICEKLEEVEAEIDEEARPGTNFPFKTDNPRWLAFKMIMFIGIAFNIPFVITYWQMKSAKTA